MKRQPTTQRKDDWLCSRCGQVSNHSEPCYDCARKERDANPVPPPPPVLSRPTRDSSRKRTHWSERQPSKTPHTKSWPARPFRFKSDRHRRAWWALNDVSSRPDPDPEATGSFGDYNRYIAGEMRKLKKPTPNYLWLAILLFIDWINRVFGAEKPKSKHPAEQMATFEDLFEEYEDVEEIEEIEE